MRYGMPHGRGGNTFAAGWYAEYHPDVDRPTIDRKLLQRHVLLDGAPIQLHKTNTAPLSSTC